MKLEQQTILITGGTSGIGLALAQRLGKNNQIIVLGRNQSKIDAVLANNPKFDAYRADVSDSSTLINLPDWIETNYPKLNIVINSAGTMSAMEMLDESVTLQRLIQDVQTNLIGTMTIDKLLLNQLVTQPESMIVNVSSGLGFISSSIHPAYSASKAGVHMFTSALREQLAYADHKHIHIIELAPPMVSETNLESTTISGPLNMKLSALVDATIKGMARTTPFIVPGASKLLRFGGKFAPTFLEKQMTKQSMPMYFPNGLH
jgi:uncharacterized oxidoreductase